MRKIIIKDLMLAAVFAGLILTIDSVLRPDGIQFIIGFMMVISCSFGVIFITHEIKDQFKK
jgi:hypothetical protein